MPDIVNLYGSNEIFNYEIMKHILVFQISQKLLYCANHEIS